MGNQADRGTETCEVGPAYFAGVDECTKVDASFRRVKLSFFVCVVLADRILVVAKKKLQFDEIGYWSEIKIEILEKYAHAYSSIISARESPRFKHYYIDAFAGAGEHVRKTTGEPVMGSPLAALSVQPPFSGYYFIELEPTKVGNLQSHIGSRSDVQIMEGDCNELLLEKVFPQVRYEEYRRAVCVLDPYGLHLDWKVIAKAGEMKSIEIFLNFPVADINRNVLWKNPEGVDLEDIGRMNTF